jgi:Ni,Fe-hydrogenase III small subunit
MKWTVVITLSICWAIASQPATAGPLTEVDLSGQALQYTKAGSIDGCGIRLVGISSPVPGVKSVSVLDVSFNVVNPGAGLVKGGLMDLPVQALVAGDMTKTSEVPIKMLWLRVPGSKATVPAGGKVLPAMSHKQALMYTTTIEPVLALIGAVHDRVPVQIGFHVTSTDVEAIYFGRIQMEKADLQQFAQCYTEWSDAMMKRLGKPPR